MNDSERLAMAAHMHVALRRKVGRVTDTEWMANNTEYGLAMVDVALKHAEESMDQELGRLALRFGAALTLALGRGAGTAQSSTYLSGGTQSSGGRDPSPWWDSNFSGSRQSSRGRDSRMPPDAASTWPPSVMHPGMGGKEGGGSDSTSPMPLRRGRYVGGLR